MPDRPIMRRAVCLAALAVLAAALLTAAPAAGSRLQDAASRAALYQQVLAFDAVDMDGRRWDHERFRGRVVLLDFWATWCAPCIRELPYLQRARSRFGDRFEVIGVSLDTRSASSLRDWLEERGISWPQIHQRRGWDDRLPTAFGIDRLPRNLLLDRQGRLRALDVRGERLLVEVERLLAETSRPPAP